MKLLDIVDKFKRKPPSPSSTASESVQDLPDGPPPPYESIKTRGVRELTTAQQSPRRSSGSKSQMVLNDKQGRSARSSSKSSTASTLSATPWSKLKKQPHACPSPATDVASGSVSHVKSGSLNITGFKWTRVSEDAAEPTAGNARTRKAHRATFRCSFRVTENLRGQPVGPTDIHPHKRHLDMMLVENFAPGQRASFLARWKKEDTPYLSWYSYFNREYPGWDSGKPDWRGAGYLEGQKDRLCSEIEIYNVR